MPLTNGTLPFNLPERLVPFDQSTAFASNQTLTATGYVNNIQTQIDLAPGRESGYLVIDVSAMDLSSNDETYRFFLLGSNDLAFGNGNVEILAVRDFAAVTAGRLVPTIVPASYAVPISGRAATRFTIPFTSLSGAFVFRYFQLYCVVAGTTPSITVSAWLSANQLIS